MIRTRLIIPLVSLLSLFTIPVQAEESKQKLVFEKVKLQLSKESGYDIVRYGDFNISRGTAAPQLPEGVIHLALPPGKDIASVTIVHLTSDTLAGRYDLYPSQRPQVFSDPTVRFIRQDQGIYSSSNPYPKEIVKPAPQGFFAGYNIGALIVYPVQYVPSKKLLIFHSEIEVEIIYKDVQRQQLPFKESAHASFLQQKSVNGMVQNPVSLSRSPVRRIQSVSSLPIEDHEYVLITSDALASSFQPLRDWKLKKGLSAKIVTTDWIYANYSGTDNQERIRDFIRDAHETWGTLWVLLGGDVSIVPARYAYAMDCQYGSPSDNNIPCDLYYSDLDGNWNANGNSIYGEITDSVDMYPDVYVGRAPVENADQATVFVNKILTYEKNPPTDYENKALFLGMVLWSSPYTNSGLGKNYIDSLYVPPRFDPITKLYQDLGNESPATVIPAMNAGQNLINHDGHAWYSVLSVGEGALGIADMDALTNGPRYSILYSIGCWPGAFDYDCIAEHFIRNPNGGGVAFIGNSRYGWGSPGNPLFGYSDRFDQQFYKKLFTDDIYHIGNTLAAEKGVFVPLAQEENVYRWCEYEINLLGEPEMPIWTDAPRTLTLTCPPNLPVGTTLCPVTVTDGGNSIEGALVCLMADSVAYATGLTGTDGRVNLEITTISPSTPLYLTVTKHNYFPAETTITLTATGPYACISSYTTNGSPAGFVSPGDPVTMALTVKNFGSDTAKRINILLVNTAGRITLIDSTVLAGTMAPGESLFIPHAFSFLADTAICNGDVIYLNVRISDSLGNLWTDQISLTGAISLLSYYGSQVSDSVFGNGNGYAEPGETLSVRIILDNKGYGTAHNTSALIRSDDPSVEVIDSVVMFGNLPPGSKNSATTRVAVTPDCTVPAFPRIDMHLSTQGGFVYTDTFFISVGIFGLSDDIENGGSNWTHSGTTDLWHMSSYRYHSGATSWYCGDENQRLYSNDMAGMLISVPVTIDQNARLSFWCWYTFPNYGTDGLYVEVNDGSGWTTLDFIGSGGALGMLTTGNRWLEYTYNLSHYAMGSSVQVRYRFVSDGSDVVEGAYIDDVRIYRDQSETLPPAVSLVDYRGGWNMVSIPRRSYNPLKTALFPASSSFAFKYSGSYEQEDTLKSGTGYWLKFSTPQTVLIEGDPVMLDSISVIPGWNLIGSISSPLPVTMIQSEGGTVTTSNFIGYNGSYYSTDTIYPGRGYWVKVNESGKLILSTLPPLANSHSVRIVQISEQPPPPPGEIVSGVQEIPKEYALEQAYPSPFNPTTIIKYQLPADSRIILKVYNTLGQVVSVLKDEAQPAGFMSVTWDASPYASGVYFYQLEAISVTDPGKSFTQVKKMLFVK